MSTTAALIILIVGIVIGYRLPAPFGRWRAAYRRRFFKPVLARRYHPDGADRRAE
ncbi:MAG: hypothetical protein H7Z39_17915 [Burkholderiaceae bacterium]|nr:hypothetical protein [Burkholderiaceae bacterium]